MIHVLAGKVEAKFVNFYQPQSGRKESSMIYEGESRERRGAIITGKQLCEMLAISPRTLQKWKSENSMPFIKAGNICRYEKDEVIAWFRQFRQNRKERCQK